MHSGSMPPTELGAFLTEQARALGFGGLAVSEVSTYDRGATALRGWLEAGHQGEMAYLNDPTGRADPRQLLAQARTLVVVALPYDAREPAGASPLVGRVARYARGRDYHQVLGVKLRTLAERVAEHLGRPLLSRACVDTAPLLEREAAHHAGLGFIAKNTMTILPGVGSYVLLGELLLDIDVPPLPGTPATPRCGQCTACLEACPTGAFVDAYVLDARRCISYLTIEHKGPIARALRPAMGRWVFGCDVCQEVCPFNAKPAPGDAALAARADLREPELIDLLTLRAKAHRRRVKDTALRRVSRHQLARNAAVALGNSGERSAVPALAGALRHALHPLVRGHAAWALGHLGGEAARAALDGARGDVDAYVRDEIEAALRA